MGDKLLSVGLDVGTTTSQMIVSELTVENRASSFAVPEMDITQRKVIYRGDVIFTPLLAENRVDAQALGRWVLEEYQRAGIAREMVDTGAVIITGETSRRENAHAVMEALAELAGDFVVATAGPDLESILSARGAGAVAYSEKTGSRVLHMDIGGGTSNLTLIADGKIVATGCLNVGGRLLKIEKGISTYVSPVLEDLTSLRPGQPADLQELERLSDLLAQVLEMAAGLREPTGLLTRLSTREAEAPWIPPEGACVISFSGGVADCIRNPQELFAYGDIGPMLGKAIGKSRLCQGAFLLGQETIRATVIGAGCHSTQLSGSTVFSQNVTFPLKNLPVLTVDIQEMDTLRERARQQDVMPVLAVTGTLGSGYAAVTELARKIADNLWEGPVYLCVEQDMAKALGQSLALRLAHNRQILCLDRIRLSMGSYLDVGSPIGPALPVVVKTLVLERQNTVCH